MRKSAKEYFAEQSAAEKELNKLLAILRQAKESFESVNGFLNQLYEERRNELNEFVSKHGVAPFEDYDKLRADVGRLSTMRRNALNILQPLKDAIHEVDSKNYKLKRNSFKNGIFNVKLQDLMIEISNLTGVEFLSATISIEGNHANKPKERFLSEMQTHVVIHGENSSILKHDELFYELKFPFDFDCPFADGTTMLEHIRFKDDEGVVLDNEHNLKLFVNCHPLYLNCSQNKILTTAIKNCLNKEITTTKDNKTLNFNGEGKK